MNNTQLPKRKSADWVSKIGAVIALLIGAYSLSLYYLTPNEIDPALIEPFPTAVADLGSAYATNDHVLNQLLNDPHVSRSDKQLVLAQQKAFYAGLHSSCKSEKNPDTCTLQYLKSNTVDLVLKHSESSTKTNKEKK